MLVPYWSVYEVLKELLLHGSKINELDSSVLMHWGWVAFIGLVAGLLLLYGALMASHVAAFRILYGLRIRLSEHIFFAERVDGSHLCGLYRLQHRFAVYEFLWQES